MKKLKMDFNIGDYILKELVTSKFIKKKLAEVLLAIVANLIQQNIVGFISFLVDIHPYFNFFFQIALSVALAINIEIFYDFLSRYEKDFYQLARYLINNWSFENYIKWKRIVTLIIVSYIVFILYTVEITNRLLVIYLVQTGITGIIMDMYHEKVFHKWYEKYRFQPAKIVFKQMPSELMESYYPERDIHLKNKETQIGMKLHINNDDKPPYLERSVIMTRERAKRLNQSLN